MKVSELIAALSECPPDSDVKFFVDWEDLRAVSDVSPEDSDGNVVLGVALPAEMFSRDYR